MGYRRSPSHRYALGERDCKEYSLHADRPHRPESEHAALHAVLTSGHRKSLQPAKESTFNSSSLIFVLVYTTYVQLITYLLSLCRRL